MDKIKEKILKDKSGEGHVYIVVVVLIIMMILSLGIKVFPAFIAKDRLNTFADKVLRESQTQGMIEIDYEKLKDNVDINIESVEWKANTLEGAKVQLDENITVICKTTVDIGLFGDFGSFKIPLRARASGKSEVFWK